MFCIVKVCVRPGTGDLKSKFMTILEGDLLTFVFEKIVGELSAEAALLVGDLQRVTLLLGAIEAEPESTNDAAGKYSSMGCARRPTCWRRSICRLTRRLYATTPCSSRRWKSRRGSGSSTASKGPTSL